VGRHAQAIEVKSTATFASEFLKPLRDFCDLSNQAVTPYIVYGGDERYTVQGISVLSFRHLAELAIEGS